MTLRIGLIGCGIMGSDHADILHRGVAGARLAAVQDAATRGDAAALEREAHALKGSAASIGAQAMAALCDTLQAMGRDGDLAHASVATQRLHGAFESASTAFQREHGQEVSCAS